MLNEFVYCPRLFFLEWVDGLFAHSADTIEGALRHRKLERRSDPLPSASDAPEQIHARSVNLASDVHKIVAVIDLVEGQGDRVTPVDYKRGVPREGADGPEPWPADVAQVCAQALILRENGYQCDEAVLYYVRTKQRVRVRIDEPLVQDIAETIARARSTAATGIIPPPLVDSPKCPRCSLVGICLPDETLATRGLGETDGPGRQLALFPDEPAEDPTWASVEPDGRGEVRRLVPARDDLRPLYVTGNGLSIGKTSEILRIKSKGETVQDVRIGEISQVNVFGNNQVTAAAVHGLCQAEKPIAHFSFGGWFYGTTQGLGLKNVFLRREQFRRADDPAFCLWVAKAMVVSKIRNQRTLLKRNHLEPQRATLDALARLSEQSARAEGFAELLGIEGNAARLYFRDFGGMIKVEDDADGFSFDFRNRNRRPPRDPVNALLSFAYSLLVKDLTVVAHTVGYDPFVGFYHFHPPAG